MWLSREEQVYTQCFPLFTSPAWDESSWDTHQFSSDVGIIEKQRFVKRSRKPQQQPLLSPCSRIFDRYLNGQRVKSTAFGTRTGFLEKFKQIRQCACGLSEMQLDKKKKQLDFHLLQKTNFFQLL